MSRPREIKNPRYLGIKIEAILWAELDTLAKENKKTMSVYLREKLMEIAKNSEN